LVRITPAFGGEWIPKKVEIFLIFRVDGIEQARISGSVSLGKAGFSFPFWQSCREWAYEKKWSGAVGADAGWVDRWAVPALQVAEDYQCKVRQWELQDSLSSIKSPRMGNLTLMSLRFPSGRLRPARRFRYGNYLRDYSAARPLYRGGSCNLRIRRRHILAACEDCRSEYAARRSL
jgi:hypothetical protein